jgi:HK97 gp10 family phage protein
MISRIKVEGLAQLRKNSATLSLELNKENRKALADEARTLRNLMRSKTPVKTGALRQAIATKKWKDKDGVTGWVVGITKESDRPEFHKGKSYYPASQEYGTSFHPAHPYIRPSWDERKNKIRTRLRNTYKKVIDKARG